ncbi:MAG TPA: selenium metabolism-associated LysR family transcriptional regulator [Geobacteraceae bacterium]|nr:selenium metabolism-associated LysR family transcriptional regulator [Geobacteraceae bacterium]
MNIKQLEVFLAVAATGSFSKGANATFITQSTVSQHISALEREFDLPLFDRTGKGALLTEAGKLLAGHAGKIIAGLDEAGEALRRFKGGEEVVLRIGGSNIPADYMIPAALPRLLQRLPGVTAIVCQGDSRGILDRLLSEEVELCVVGSSFPLEGVEFSPLGTDMIRLVAGNSHPWRGRSSVSIAELAAEPLVVREPGSGTGKSVREALATAGLNPAAMKTTAVLGSNEAVKQAVMEGLGVSFVSELSVKQELERGALGVVDLQGVEIVRRFYLAARSGRSQSPAAQAFAAVMREMYAAS